MIDSIFLYPFLGGAGVALICGPLGSFMVWQRLSFFSDSLSHATMLGVALSLVFSFDLWIGLLCAPLFLAWVLVFFLHNTKAMVLNPADSVLLLLSQGALAVSFMSLSLKGLPAVDLVSYLLGDILTLQRVDVLFIWGGGLLILLILTLLWKPLLLLTLHEEMVALEGYNPHLIRFILLTLMAVSLGFALKVMGALLLSSLLVAPPLTARPFVKNPESMCICASLLGLLWIIGGLGVSMIYDVPTGPAISTLSVTGFCISRLYEKVKNIYLSRYFL